MNTIHILFELLIEKMNLEIEGETYQLVFIREDETKKTALTRFCRDHGISKKGKFAYASISDLSN